MSGVLAKKFARRYSDAGVCVSSVRYSRSSAGVLRHVKYVYDSVKPSFARYFMRLGRVNASLRKIVPG